jgi:hypothetical protein
VQEAPFRIRSIVFVLRIPPQLSAFNFDDSSPARSLRVIWNQRLSWGAAVHSVSSLQRLFLKVFCRVCTVLQTLERCTTASLGDIFSAGHANHVRWEVGRGGGSRDGCVEPHTVLCGAPCCAPYYAVHRTLFPPVMDLAHEPMHATFHPNRARAGADAQHSPYADNFSPAMIRRAVPIVDLQGRLLAPSSFWRSLPRRQRQRRGPPPLPRHW